PGHVFAWGLNVYPYVFPNHAGNQTVMDFRPGKNMGYLPHSLYDLLTFHVPDHISGECTRYS
ncbi:hypothetical protein, partial [Akkermansia sp.]|uniref:hypothetical protein n=1 Tax=Akkermansia sp. TaxID=1872421 RepID=UPI003AB436A3